jgi:sugar lactone lactonase YvrE
MTKQIGDYEILFHWPHLDWLFDDPQAEAEFRAGEYWKGAMPAGVKLDRHGTYYVSVPRWEAGIPATVNRIEFVDGRPMLAAYPNWEMNRAGDPAALQSVLGWEIDEQGCAWFLDQGHIQGAPCADGAQKIVCWNMERNTLLDSIPIPDHIASYQASFLNDLVIDNANGFIYIADSGIFSDPLQGGLIVYNRRTRELRRVLHQHASTQDLPGYWFEIAGKKVWRDRPMRTGADGIALSADRRTLYWCALTGRNLYALETRYLQDFSIPHAEIEAAVQDLGDKGTNSDGMGADNRGAIYYTMLEGQGIGVYNPAGGSGRAFRTLFSDPRMVWVDGLTFDNEGNIIFNNNRLHELFGGELDWADPYNLIVWRAFVGDGVKSYLHGSDEAAGR